MLICVSYPRARLLGVDAASTSLGVFGCTREVIFLLPAGPVDVRR
jgi:hypothetical protein